MDRLAFVLGESKIHAALASAARIRRQSANSGRSTPVRISSTIHAQLLGCVAPKTAEPLREEVKGSHFNGIQGGAGAFSKSLVSVNALAQLQELSNWRAGRLCLVEAVSADNIVLRVAHDVRRGNGTRFQGRLLIDAGGSSLVGTFKSSAVSRIFAAISLLFLGVMLCGGVLGGIRLAFTPGPDLLDPLRYIAFLSLWSGAVCLIGWLVIWNASPVRSDVIAISAVIRQALLRQERES
ncbi:hypothetical protein [Paraburkholderia rhynchosiae]|uniref:Uncharacterized protein n=1 Tax=Paraburkholderia rhynchosiae TaxID=487049 RepID=A0A6J5BR31_9BURK|nr:hypothetical protein [Paraburkholderia rhynchosiae]CAB3711466.1 hypothetical protein LMG27174_04261 [Paraburkholderia rhynchosiae]